MLSRVIPLLSLAETLTQADWVRNPCYPSVIPDFSAIVGRGCPVQPYCAHGYVLGRPAAGADPAAGLQLPGRNLQNSNYARQFSRGFSYPVPWARRPCWGGITGVKVGARELI